MGPFELMDLIGHDVNYKVTTTVHEAFLETLGIALATLKDNLSQHIGWAAKQAKVFLCLSRASQRRKHRHRSRGCSGTNFGHAHE